LATWRTNITAQGHARQDLLPAPTMWMIMCVYNNLVLHLPRNHNMMLPVWCIKSVPKRTNHHKAKHTKELQPFPIAIDPMRSILLKIKLNMTPYRFSIKKDNFSMWTVHKFPTPPGPLVDLHNKMVDVISHMTMMVTTQFSMIKMDADTMTTIAAMSSNFNMIAKGR
jgi:hypothetical protein